MGIGGSISREWRRIANRPMMIVASVGVPLFCALFIGSIFGNGRMEELPIAVIDNDFSSTSRSIIRTLDASPSLQTSNDTLTLPEAFDALKRREIYGIVIIPQGFSDDIVSGRSTSLPYYYHYAYLSIGTTVQSTLQTLLTTISLSPLVEVGKASGIAPTRIEEFLLPIEAATHPLFNPTLNFNTYLVVPFYFIMLQIVVMMVTVYSLGNDIESGGGRDWISQAGNNMAKATLGKIAPYTFLFWVSTIISVFLLTSLSHTPSPQFALQIILYALLLIVASQGIGVTIYACIGRMDIALSISSMIGSLGATLSGVTFPLREFYAPFELSAYLLPIRHFTILTEDLPYGGSTIVVLCIHIAILHLFSLLPLIFLRRLRHLATSERYAPRTTS